MPAGAFKWLLWRSSATGGGNGCFSFDAAVVGEYAMKKLLATRATHLNGEFYLATSNQIDEAWRHGIAAAESASSAS